MNKTIIPYLVIIAGIIVINIIRVPAELDQITIAFIIIAIAVVAGALYSLKRKKRKIGKTIVKEKKSEKQILKEISKLEKELSNTVSEKREKEIEKKILELEEELEEG